MHYQLFSMIFVCLSYPLLSVSSQGHHLINSPDQQCTIYRLEFGSPKCLVITSRTPIHELEIQALGDKNNPNAILLSVTAHRSAAQQESKQSLESTVDEPLLAQIETNTSQHRITNPSAQTAAKHRMSCCARLLNCCKTQESSCAS